MITFPASSSPMKVLHLDITPYVGLIQHIPVKHFAQKITIHTTAVFDHLLT